MVDGKGGLRPHWRAILGAFAAFGEGGLQERGRRLDHAFAEEGVASLLPGARNDELAWRCDPVPLPIPAGEFARLEIGLAQRASLLEAILGDLYGRQSLLSDGTLPPALVYANKGYLRLGRDPGRAPYLHFYAADLIRDPQGDWRVLADRTGNAGGISYARENRRLLSRVLPEAFRPVQVNQLRPFFDIWQDALRRLAPGGKPNPAIALLTPGTSHRHWFEHMYLSRELSCDLVEGGDLTVRDGTVFLKTLKGLKPIDVLLRRVDGRLIDPLELDSSSVGVPGLIDAARGGTVRITNDPGTGVIEAPGLSAFLPALAGRLLGERLKIEGVPTMWLGHEASREELRNAPANWVLRPALDAAGRAVVPADMEPTQRQDLQRRIAARPWEWAASAMMRPSVAPCLTATGLEPMPIVMRVFLVNDGNGWRAMQGGLARVLRPDMPLDGNAPGLGLSKDVWVLSEDRPDIIGPPALTMTPLALRRTTGDLPSRVADNLYWLGRYVERIERAARLVRAAILRLARGSAMLPRESTELQALCRCLAEAGVIPAETAASLVNSVTANALLAALREEGTIHDLFATLARLTERVRDRLTGDMYATFTQTLRAARAESAEVAAARPGEPPDMERLTQAMVGILRFSTAVAGVAAENMVRGGGWMFLDLGRRVERAQAVTREIAFALDQPPARIETGLRLVLELCDSAITYRSRYLNVVQAAPVLDLVLADQGNPRGLAFQFVAMHALLDELGGEDGPRELSSLAAGLLVEAETLVDAVLRAPDQTVAAADLPPRLDELATHISNLSNQITRRYFALLPAVQTLGVGTQEAALRGAA
jgi:uncharacterized circularly permuted ATP-grasp superfamily protein/uncharacterized alpha-E superfamily protein